jgi:hypothetical protein
MLRASSDEVSVEGCINTGRGGSGLEFTIGAGTAGIAICTGRLPVIADAMLCVNPLDSFSCFGFLLVREVSKSFCGRALDIASCDRFAKPVGVAAEAVCVRDFPAQESDARCEDGSSPKSSCC